MTVAVTGAAGHLGRLIVEDLLARGLPAEQIVAGTRRLEAVKDLADRGVQVRHADFDAPQTLAAAFAGADKVLIVSGTDVGRRAAQHTVAAEAAQRAGARLIVHTSTPYADTTRMKLAAEHAATERAIRELGVPFTFLRNAWYYETRVSQLRGG
jgi:NAD(P)H dehydrogenase (quinone)